jgi:hypothetical protein
MAAGGKMCHGISVFLHIADIMNDSNLNVAQPIQHGFGWNKYGQTMPAAPDWPTRPSPWAGRVCCSISMFLHIADIVKYRNLNVVQPILHRFGWNKYNQTMLAASYWCVEILQGVSSVNCAWRRQ